MSKMKTEIQRKQQHLVLFTTTSTAMIRLLLLSTFAFSVFVVNGAHWNPRHCRGSPKHIHIAVGPDPTSSMTISFATKWAYPDNGDPPLGGIHYGTSPAALDQFVGEQEFPITYNSSLGIRHAGETYYAPYQHHITIEGLQPDTTYYYVIVTLNDREQGIDVLAAKDLRDHPTQHLENIENWVAETQIMDGIDKNRDGDEDEEVRYLYSDDGRIRHGRQLAPPPYDGHDKPCVEGHRVRQFRTAPVPTTERQVSFAVIGDLGQFDHSQETLTHMEAHRQGIDAVILGGDIAYTGFDPRGWDTFFDFLDDYSIFGEVPLMIANGNHGK